MVLKRLAHLGAIILSLVALAGCSEPTGFVSDGGMGEVTITLQRTGFPPASAVTEPDGGWAAAPEGRVSGDLVVSLTITITDIQLLRRCEEEQGEEGEVNGEADPGCTENGGWHALPLDESVTIDLLALPAEDESPAVIASGALPVGDYHNIRLFARDETVVFAESFSIGNSLFDADTEYPVEIPSGEKTGIKTDLALTVVDDGEGNGEEVNLLFDLDATFRGVVATGSGKVMLPPVLKVRPPSE
ncbi:MAG: DUF4382 domain-containing protein [Gemmatimonadota bacterium]|nr:MAG: DUF4382 domain-containing protein [Gemmatimonadota bacterium]